MAYDFFPKNQNDIKTALKTTHNPETIKEVTSVFNALKAKTPVPINLDRKKPNNINVSRQLQGSVDLKELSKSLKLKIIKMKFGNGSAGNRGVNNKGAGFEKNFYESLNNWWKGEPVDPKMLKAIEDLDKTYGLSKSKDLHISVEAASNTKRPLTFGDNGITLLNSKGKGNNVGPTLSDITITYNGTKKIYLSLKSSSTVTFFNVGVRTILSPTEIKSGKITNLNGRKLLNLFGINDKKFCDIFNGVGKGSVDANAKAQVQEIQKLLESGVGYGYHILHEYPKYIESKKMDERSMKEATKIGPVTVYYGGLTGTGKRIDISFESPEYAFKLNIRDTQGADGYPTRLMCDFKGK